MNIEKSMATLGKAFGDESRAKMLCALMNGKALTATELACVADIMPATASGHLQKLIDAELLRMCKQGRHHYFQLANSAVAELIESMGNMIPVTVNTGPKAPELRFARVCYNHIAGELGVKLLDRLLVQQFLVEEAELLTLTDTGEAFFSSLGFDKTAYAKRRPTCRLCLDWSERRHHLAGTLGVWVLDYVQEKRWATQVTQSRALIFNESGREMFERVFLKMT